MDTLFCSFDQRVVSFLECIFFFSFFCRCCRGTIWKRFFFLVGRFYLFSFCFFSVSLSFSGLSLRFPSEHAYLQTTSFLLSFCKLRHRIAVNFTFLFSRPSWATSVLKSSHDFDAVILFNASHTRTTEPIYSINGVLFDTFMKIIYTCYIGSDVWLIDQYSLQ